LAVTLDDVRHIAMLARLGLSDDRAKKLMAELNTILVHMEALSKADTSGLEETAAVGLSGMWLRPDQGPKIPLERPPESFAPEMRDGFLLVPRLSTHEDAEATS
jgi:aspartyl-tRNA(Asn)/glutamyl-tRNA(Gln) amidotransferase subunit C